MGKFIIGGTEEMEKEKTRFNQKGITLIALVITKEKNIKKAKE